ncbi:MAG: M36 family metallopeptidase, partial [Acidimicrobiales bacterium]
MALEPIPVSLKYHRTADGRLILAWEATILETDAQDWWQIRVNAETGDELDRNNFVADDTDLFADMALSLPASPLIAEPLAQAAAVPNSYNVYPLPLEAPSFGARSLQVDPADPAASPFGWHDTNGAAGAEFTVTTGNNVNAYLDTNADNMPDPGSQPDGGVDLSFDFPHLTANVPANSQAAAVTNLFYTNNVIHDILYAYGFDEAAGNFQTNNYGNGGAGGDAVLAEAQDGAGVNNANFATPNDGSAPRMQMFTWTAASPDRDSGFDNGVIIHEYGHGVSNRLTGGPAASFCLNNEEQAGEGWSDYLALMLTMETGDTGTDGRGIASYLMNQPATGQGIRDYRYSTDIAADPRTYDTIKTSNGSAHRVGSTFAAMLWEMTWALIDEHGLDADLTNGTGGNNLALQLVIDGLKMQPCSPGFVDARDAILDADTLNNGGQNRCIIWEAFSKRGLGFSASQGLWSSVVDGTEAFDTAPECFPLLLEKAASETRIPIGQQLTYSLTATNQSDAPQTSVLITDVVPSGTTYVGGSATCGGTETNGTVTFGLGNLSPAQAVVCQFAVTVDAGLAEVFYDDLSTGSTNWTTTHGLGASDWTLSQQNATTPPNSMYAQNVAT